MSIATTDVQVASKALVLIGANPITGFTDGSTEATVADAIYHEHVEGLITGYPWRFTMQQEAMNLLASAPDTLWDAAYQQPSDCLNLERVTVNDIDIDYAVYGDQVYCNAASGDTVVADYQARVDEAAWPAWFRIATEFELASVFGGSVAGKADLAKVWGERADTKMRLARQRDAQQQTSKKFDSNRFIAARR